MKNLISKISFLVIIFLLLSCDTTNENDTDKLDVKFENSSSSSFTITSIETMTMGESGNEIASPSGKWSSNLLTSEEAIAPGAYKMFRLEIKNRHYVQYRLAVLDENDNEVFLHSQVGYPASSVQGTITHWGSDERTVQVTIVRNQNTNRITVSGYSDWAGIDD